MSYECAQLEIIRVSNGFAVYDFQRRQYDLMSDRKAVPMVVFHTKEQLVEWMLKEWKDSVIYPELEKA